MSGKIWLELVPTWFEKSQYKSENSNRRCFEKLCHTHHLIVARLPNGVVVHLGKVEPQSANAAADDVNHSLQKYRVELELTKVLAEQNWEDQVEVQH